MRILFLVTCLMSVALNRIKAPTDPAKRCMSTGVSNEKCETYRAEALKMNCITKDEYHTLKKYGAYPSCNFLKGEGLDMLDGWCSCGCFSLDTKISTLDIKSNILLQTRADQILQSPKLYQVNHLSKDSTLEHFLFDESSIRIAVKGLEQKKMYTFLLEDNTKLTVTEKHPILLSSGQMKQAQEIKLSDTFVNIDNKNIKIISISQSTEKQEVMNFSTESDNILEHIVFANNIACGDLYWQSSLEDMFNRVIIRQ